MDSLAEILEADLAEAFEVKNRTSLHRYITLLIGSLAQRENNDREHSEFREAIIRIDSRIEEGFKRMDQRFESMQRTMDERFESMQRTMDERFKSVQNTMDIRFVSSEKRFDDMNRRFTMLFSFMTTGFVALATLITVFQLVG